jgi:hypothetical protein
MKGDIDGAIRINEYYLENVNPDCVFALCTLSTMYGYRGETLKSGETFARIKLEKAKGINLEASKRILIKGDVDVSLDAANVFASSGVLLLGNEPQTVGPQDSPMAVHLALLSAGVALLEGICLSEVLEGVYFLSAALITKIRIIGMQMIRSSAKESGMIPLIVASIPLNMLAIYLLKKFAKEGTPLATRYMTRLIAAKM